MHIKSTLKSLLLSPLLALVLITGSALVLTGCEDQGPVEEAGEAIDEAAEDTADAIDDAAEELEDGNHQ
ncbi:MAG: hypothetical protein PF630_10110 [Gammaproteobacteria bacterium]|jgi:PBP1b-binding outer membrane lipoprotein LpoB|nr:hypothetical protein [Gammaproteobacteria bacterium]